ncbi:unnamed protein product [Musa hybrid cultivar]
MGIVHLHRVGGGDLDDEAGEDVVGVVDVRVALDDERVAALVADGVQRLPLAHHVDLVARAGDEPPAAGRLVQLRRRRALPQRAQQHDRHQGQRDVPRRGVQDGHDGGQGSPCR